MTPTALAPAPLKLNFRPHAKQAEYLALQTPYKLALAGLQSGKTHVGAVEGLLKGIEAIQILASKGWTSEAIGVAVAPTIEMNRDVLQPAYRRVLESEPLLRRLLLGKGRTWEQCFVKTENTLKCYGAPFPFALKFRSAEDGVLRLAGLTNVVFIHGDEGSRWKDGQAVWQVVRTRVATMHRLDKRLGHIWITTTPDGFDWTHQAIEVHAKNGNPQYGMMHWTAWDNPYRSLAELDDAKATTPPHLFERDFLALRTSSAASAFPGVRECVRPITAQVKYDRPHDTLWLPPDGWELGGTVCSTGVDLAISNDYTCIVVRGYGLGELDLIAFRRWKPRSFRETQDVLLDWYTRFGGRVNGDQTGLGEGPIREFRAAGIPINGIHYTAEVRTALLTHKALLQAHGRLPMPACEVWLQEHERFGPQSRAGMTERLDHPPGGHDDLVMADALAVHGCRPAAATMMVGQPR